jgi:hypothetical protein
MRRLVVKERTPNYHIWLYVYQLMEAGEEGEGWFESQVGVSLCTYENLAKAIKMGIA